MIPPRCPSAQSTPVNGLAARLEALRAGIERLEPERPAGLAAIRADLDSLRAESDSAGLETLGRLLQRLSSLTEVWECLAQEGSGSAREVASFCQSAVECLHQAAASGEEIGRSATSWIREESSARWSDYLALIEPEGTSIDLPDGVSAADWDQAADPAPDLPAIDSETLVRLLSGGAAPPSEEQDAFTDARLTVDEPEPPVGDAALEPQACAWEAAPGPSAVDVPAPGSPWVARPSSAAVPSAPLTLESEPAPSPPPSPASVAGAKPFLPQSVCELPEIDPECREAFLAEATDLFERVGSLVLGLRVGRGQESSLHELGRCFHTLKGAAGSVGLTELTARIHQLEEELEDASGTLSPPLLERLHQALGHLEAVLDALRKGSRPAGSTPRSEPAVNPAPGNDTLENGSLFESTDALGEFTAAPVEVADGPIRVPSGRMDELMDLTSELIMRRGVWADQAGKLKEVAALIRGGRHELQLRIDQLRALGLGRSAEPRGARKPVAPGSDRGAMAGSDEAATVILRLVEQVEDLVVLTDALQAHAFPVADESDSLARLTLQLWDSLQSIRIVPIRGLFQRLARVAYDAARVEGRTVDVIMVGEETGLDRAVQDKAFEPLLHIVRNAVGHGIEPPAERARAGKPASGRLTLEARREGNTLVLSVQDDGRGLDYAAIAEKGRRLGLLEPGEAPAPERLNALIFRSGFSTRAEANAISGRGVGMDVVAQEVRRLRGTIDLTSQTGAGTRITLRLPARLALEQAMIARAAGQALAIPISLIEHAQPFEPGDVEGESPRLTVKIREQRVPLIVAREALGFSGTDPASCPKLLLVRAEGDELALLFDAIEGTRELVIKPLGPLLAGHPVIWGTSLSLTGDVIFVLNPSGLLRWHCKGLAGAAIQGGDQAVRRAPVLVVDDSISVRRAVTRQLRLLGLDVEEVSNGVEALGKLSCRSYSMVLTDLEMPRMDGFELLAELQRSPTLSALPVIVASTESRPATRRRALALGARSFLAKPIDQDELARVAGSLLSRAGHEV